MLRDPKNASGHRRIPQQDPPIKTPYRPCQISTKALILLDLGGGAQMVQGSRKMASNQLFEHPKRLMLEG